MDGLHRNVSRMDSEHSKKIVRLLRDATNSTPHYYGNDVKTAALLLNKVLQYESRQAGFELTAMKDAEFNEVWNKYVKMLNFYKVPLWSSFDKTCHFLIICHFQTEFFPVFDSQSQILSWIFLYMSSIIRKMSNTIFITVVFQLKTISNIPDYI